MLLLLSAVVTVTAKPTVQLDLGESATICRQTSNSRTSRTAVSDRQWRRFYLDSGTKALYKHSYVFTSIL